MSRRKVAIGLTMLCALVVSAASASSAFAATEGTTSFTCSSAATTKTFTDEHCLTKGASGNTFGHVAITGATTVVGSNAKTASSTTAAAPANLKGTIAGIAVELQCTTVSSTGTQENVLSGEKHSIKGSNIVIKYTGCTVLLPSGKGCVVKGGAITTNTLTAASTNTSIVFSPPASGIFTEITLEGCSVAALNGTFPVKGTAASTPNGATLSATDEGTTGTLTFAGQKAGLTQTETIRMSGEGGKPIVSTGPPFLTD